MNNTAPLDSFGRKFLTLLTIFLVLRIMSYCTLVPSSIGVTRVLKIGLRFLLTGITIPIFFYVKERFSTYKIHFRMILPLGFYLAYLLLGVISLLWSTGKGFTALQLAMTIESMVFVYIYFRIIVLFEKYYGLARSLYSRMLARAILWCCLYFLIGLLVDPEMFFRDTHGGAVQRLGGFIMNPNELGMLSVLGASVAYVELLNKDNKFFNGLIVVICLTTLLLTQSRSSLGAFVLVSGFYILLMENYFIKASVITGGVLVAPVVLNTIVFKEGDVDEVMSMTGRLPFWSDLIEMAFPDRPILGYGFMRISPSHFTDKFDSIHAYAASMTHNTFVQVLINLGLVGMFIVILQMMVTFYAIGIHPNKWIKVSAAWQLIPLIINSTTEFGIFGEANYGIFFYQMIIMMFTVTALKKPERQPEIWEIAHKLNLKH